MKKFVAVFALLAVYVAAFVPSTALADNPAGGVGNPCDGGNPNSCLNQKSSKCARAKGYTELCQLPGSSAVDGQCVKICGDEARSACGCGR